MGYIVVMYSILILDKESVVFGSICHTLEKNVSFIDKFSFIDNFVPIEYCRTGIFSGHINIAITAGEVHVFLG